LRATSHDAQGEIRGVELDGHPFFVATLFQPERAALRGEVPPIVAAVRTARERAIPFLGTCGGFQHAIMELAASLAGIETPRHAEYGIADGAVIVELECSLVGHEGPIAYTPGTLIQRIAGVDRSLERYHCSYGIAPGYVTTLEDAGVVFGAHDQDGAPRALELPGHPFFLGTLFQPELAGDGTRAHPVIRAFAEATTLRTGEVATVA
jgi:CTP synthase (UTP-ammonia lyase)